MFAGTEYIFPTSHRGLRTSVKINDNHQNPSLTTQRLKRLRKPSVFYCTEVQRETALSTSSQCHLLMANVFPAMITSKSWKEVYYTPDHTKHNSCLAVLSWCGVCCVGFFFKPTWHLQYSLHLIQPSLQILLQIYQECSFHHLLERGKSHTRVTILLFLLMTCFLISVRDHSCSSVLCIPCQAIHIHSSFNLISQNNPCSSSEFFFLLFSHQLVSCRKHFRIEHYIVAMLRWENIQCSLFLTSHIN